VAYIVDGLVNTHKESVRVSGQNSQRVPRQPRQAGDQVHSRVCRAFGKVLRAARTKSGMSQQTLANGAGADRSYLSMLERGLQQPTLTMLFRIAKALSTQPEQLITATVERLEKDAA
jgi:ribosome-binding protein aMBF1 (putative translation factor)